MREAVLTLQLCCLTFTVEHLCVCMVVSLSVCVTQPYVYSNVCVSEVNCPEVKKALHTVSSGEALNRFSLCATPQVRGDHRQGGAEPEGALPRVLQNHRPR